MGLARDGPAVHDLVLAADPIEAAPTPRRTKFGRTSGLADDPARLLYG